MPLARRPPQAFQQRLVLGEGGARLRQDVMPLRGGVAGMAEQRRRHADVLRVHLAEKARRAIAEQVRVQ